MFQIPPKITKMQNYLIEGSCSKDVIIGISQKSDGTVDDYFVWRKEIEPEITMDNKNEIDKCDDSSDDYIIE